MHRVLSLLACLSLAWCSEDTPAAPTLPAAYVPPSDTQLMTLGGSTESRPKRTEITWPAEPGQAEICLWRDDKYAACSITIDDNNKPDHAWWLAITAKHNIKVTFFLVTGGIDGANKGYNGTWDDWRAMHAAGHDIQSHTISHSKTGDTDPEEKTIKEYAASKAIIEEKLPGHRCVSLAYPWGKGRPDLAKDYFIAVRGVNGTPSSATGVNYLNTNKGSLNPDMINAILGLPITKVKWLNNPAYKRGWIQPLYHLVAHGGSAEEKKKSVASAEAEIENLVAHRDRIWIDTFTAVAKYGQERDSATLTTAASTPERIELALKDRMRDDLFDQPLTLKVRLPDAWTTVNATQKDSAVAATLVKHEDKPYALVQAVPDRGPIVLKP